MGSDAGLDSAADVRVFTLLLLGGLAAVVVICVVAVLLGASWFLVLPIAGAYALISVTQWAAANARVRRTRAEMAQRDSA
ncbi:MAG: hypothetical protein IH940_09980 [Acidobacteria bacterium]|nr:hypothetical protein [Acidobacteriota bacterium]